MSRGRELSVVAGFTYNFENRDTDYRNGTDYWGLRGYGEFGGRNRPAGWSVWLTLSLPLSSRQ